MLDEDEFAPIGRLYSGCLELTKKHRKASKLPLERRSMHDTFAPVRRAYERLTGFVDCHQDAVMHHRLSLYGPACKSCGKPLRTPEARHCAACGKPKEGA